MLEPSNPSLVAGALFAVSLSFRILLLGWTWRWLFPSSAETGSNWKNVLIQTNRVILCGLPLGILLTLALGLAGHYTFGAELLCLIGLAAAGVLLGRKQAAAALRGSPAVVYGLPVLLLAAWFWPNPGQWLAGGWDPGVYLNQAVTLERDGNFHPKDEVFQKDLSLEEQSLFLRQFINRTERFPGILVDYERSTIRYELHRVTPAAFAMFIRSGNLHAGFQANRILGLLCLLSLVALLLQHSRTSHALFGGLLLLTNPVWLYHIQVPVSEVLQLYLILSAGHLFCTPSKGRGPTLLLGLLLAAGIMNRFSFLPFAGLFLCAMAYRDLEREDRSGLFGTHLILGLFCAAAVMANLTFAWDSILGWHKRFLIFQVALVAVGIEWALLLAGTRPTLNRLLSLQPKRLTVPASIGLCLGLVILWNTGHRNPMYKDLDNVFKIAQYMGWAIGITAMAGGLRLVFRKSSPWSHSFTCFLLFLFGISALMLIEKNIVDIYPWALRRYLPYLVPLTCILAAFPAAEIWQAKLPGKIRIPLLTFCLVIPIALTAPKSRDAARQNEYVGLADQIQAISEQLQENDVIVADSPTWGTPLHLAAGATVLNGKRLWESGKPYPVEKGLEALAGLHQKGYRIRFLTTTDKGLDWYAAPIEPATLDWTSPTYHYEVTIHHRKITSFKTKPQTRTLRLYTWSPEG